jgi:hypothetical protein
VKAKERIDTKRIEIAKTGTFCRFFVLPFDKIMTQSAWKGSLKQNIFAFLFVTFDSATSEPS